MIQNLRQIKLRIRSVENTRKITKAMEMVSSAKLSRVRNILYASKSYSTNLELILKDLLKAIHNPTHPLLEKRDTIKNVMVAIITSDAGLCSAYNHNVIRTAEDFLRNYSKEDIRLIVVGREAFGYFTRHGYRIAHSYLGLQGKYSPEIANDIMDKMTLSFLSREADEAWVVYTKFSGMLRHKPVAEKFLNMDHDGGGNEDYLFEPKKNEILAELISKFISVKMRNIMLNAFTSEHSARMFAMKTATDNAEELIDTLVLARNKARQTAITKEVLEVIMSAEALKG